MPHPLTSGFHSTQFPDSLAKEDNVAYRAVATNKYKEDQRNLRENGIDIGDKSGYNAEDILQVAVGALGRARTKIHLQHQSEVHTHRRASMVRLGAEKDCIDDFDWDAMVAEQVELAAAAAAEEEELRLANSVGTVVTFDTTPAGPTLMRRRSALTLMDGSGEMPRQPRAGKNNRSSGLISPSPHSATMQRVASRSDTHLPATPTLPDIARKGRNATGSPAPHNRFPGIDAYSSSRSATPESSAPSATVTDPGPMSGPADSLLSRLRMSNFYDKASDHSTSMHGKSFKIASAQGLPMKEQIHAPMKDDGPQHSRSHGGAGSPATGPAHDSANHKVGLLPALSNYPNVLQSTRRHSMIEIPSDSHRPQELSKIPANAHPQMISAVNHVPPPSKGINMSKTQLADQKTQDGVLDKFMSIFRR